MKIEITALAKTEPKAGYERKENTREGTRRGTQEHEILNHLENIGWNMPKWYAYIFFFYVRN